MTEARKNRIFDCAVFVFTVLWFAVFAAARIDLHHDGVMLKPAIDVAAGRVIFRDTFCQYGALAVWLQALAVKIFGGELIVIQLLTVLFYGGTAVLSDRIFRRFLSFPFRLVNLALFYGMAPFYVLPMHPWSSVYALFFMLLSTEFLLRSLEKEQPVFPALAGACAACAFLARHPCGVVCFGAGALTLVLASCFLKRRWRDLGIFSAGSAAVLVPFVLYLLIVGAWNDYLRQCFGFVGAFALERGGGGWVEMSGRFFPIFDGLLPPLDFFFSLLPLVCVAAGLRVFFRLTRGGEAERPAAVGHLAVILAALAAWHQYYPVPCARHLYWAAIPMFGVFALVCEKLWRNRSRRGWCRAAAVALCLAALPAVGVRLWGAAMLLRSFGGRTALDLPGVRHLRLSGAEHALLDNLARAYAELPPEVKARGVFNCTPDGMISVVFPETKFRHPMFVNWKGAVYRDYPALAMDYILTHRPPLISQQPVELPGYSLRFYGELYGLGYFFYSPQD